MNSKFFRKINVKLFKEKSFYLCDFQALLYINRYLALPSLCKALHNDGWGEGFEQREIRAGDEDIYISFWDSGDKYFLKPESEVFPEQNYEMKFGG